MIIRSSHRMQLKDDGQSLTIKQLRNEDSGVYTCVAENSLHRIAASTDLRVREPSKNLFFDFNLSFKRLNVFLSSTVLFSTYVKFNNIRWSIRRT